MQRNRLLVLVVISACAGVALVAGFLCAGCVMEWGERRCLGVRPAGHLDYHYDPEEVPPRSNTLRDPDG